MSSKIGRHFWRRPGVALDAEDWDRLPDRFGLDPTNQVEAKELIAAVRQTMFDVRAKLRSALVANGYLHESAR